MLGDKCGELRRVPQRRAVDAPPTQRVVKAEQFGRRYAEQPKQRLFRELVLGQLLVGARIEPVDDLPVGGGAHVAGLVGPTALPIPEPGHLVVARADAVDRQQDRDLRQLPQDEEMALLLALLRQAQEVADRAGSAL
jgi:hypothetical protein